MRAAAFCTCSSVLLTVVPGLYHAAAHHVNRGSTTASTSRLTYFAFSPPRLRASNPTPTIAFDAFDTHDDMCSLKSTTFGSLGEREREILVSSQIGSKSMMTGRDWLPQRKMVEVGMLLMGGSHWSGQIG
ncbi:hypothetical protein OF846_005438 [Rhodotorula toruloides]|nr:hypothetical protein OF846_005437 [Rhodotorula toruloides]KAJ8291414.1 hypothetical protein OF846_005438 [Rhodotorula toruloides]